MFHLSIAELTGSSLLTAASADARMRLNDLLNAIPVLQRNIDHTARQHAAIANAILAGDAARARIAVAEHLEGTAALLRGFLHLILVTPGNHNLERRAGIRAEIIQAQVLFDSKALSIWSSNPMPAEHMIPGKRAASAEPPRRCQMKRLRSVTRNAAGRGTRHRFRWASIAALAVLAMVAAGCGGSSGSGGSSSSSSSTSTAKAAGPSRSWPTRTSGWPTRRRTTRCKSGSC